MLGGINGAGKTTASRELLENVLKIPYVRECRCHRARLERLNPESEAFRAGRIMLEQMHQMVKNREDFSFETTLSARTYAPWLKEMLGQGYEVMLYYYWLDSPSLAIGRVAARVRSGGHFVPDADIRRRYARSVKNFLELYRPVADWWEVFDNSHGQRVLLAIGSREVETIDHPDIWEAFKRSAENV